MSGTQLGPCLLILSPPQLSALHLKFSVTSLNQLLRRTAPPQQVKFARILLPVSLQTNSSSCRWFDFEEVIIVGTPATSYTDWNLRLSVGNEHLLQAQGINWEFINAGPVVITENVVCMLTSSVNYAFELEIFFSFKCKKLIYSFTDIVLLCYGVWNSQCIFFITNFKLNVWYLLIHSVITYCTDHANKSFKYGSYFTNSDTNGKLIEDSLPSK